MAERLCLGCMEKINDKYDVCPYCGYEDGTPPKEAYHIVPGTVLAGKYIVGRVIGYGGFGVTYIGYDGLLEKKIAIKEYLPSEFATRMPGQTEVTVYSGERQEQFYSGIDKFVEEAKRLAQFKEVPGVVRIFDSFTENKTAYIIMEYLDGETLKERLEREKQLSVDDSLAIIMPILTALKEVHKIGIIHRDIAPDNIFLTKNGEVKLLDFGAARYATTTHSKSLSVIIKQGYAPEEQYRSKGDQGPWTDVYACGATLYKMLTGVTPEDSMERAGKDTLKPVSHYGVKISKNLNTAIMNAMNIRIEDRTQSAEEFEEELMSEVEVKRKKAHSRKMDIGKWPLGVKIAAGTAACALITFGVLLATNVIHFDMKEINDQGLLAANEVYVPNLVNSAMEQAETQTVERGLVLQITDKQNSDEIPKNKVLSQNIQDGWIVEVGSSIEIVISAGGEIVYIGDIEGLTKEEVEQQLKDLGLEIEIVEEASDSIAPGAVIRYEADADENGGIEKGSKVKLVVSTGRTDIDTNADTTVPQVVGLTYQEAMGKAGAAKLYIYRIRGEYSASVPKGQVIEQNIAAGSTVKQGSSLGVVVSLGIQGTRVPDVQYKEIAAATAAITASNLTYSIRYEDSDTVAKDHVIRQSIAGGTEVNPQTEIILYVSKGNPNVTNKETVAINPSDRATEADNGKKNTTAASTTETVASNEGTSSAGTTEEAKVTVPSLIGCTEAEAKQKLEAIGLTLGAVTRKEQDGGTDGKVFEQGVNKNTKVAKGTAISISVCDNSTKKVTVPNIVGKSEAEARRALERQKLSMVVLGYRNDNGVSENGTVLVEEHIGEEVARKTEIGVYLCDNSQKVQYAMETRHKEETGNKTATYTTAGLYQTTPSVDRGYEYVSIISQSYSVNTSRRRTSNTVEGWRTEGDGGAYADDATHEPTTEQRYITNYYYWGFYCPTHGKNYTAPCDHTHSDHTCGSTYVYMDTSAPYLVTDYSHTGYHCSICGYSNANQMTVNGNKYWYVKDASYWVTMYGYYPCITETTSYTYTYTYKCCRWSAWIVDNSSWSDTPIVISDGDTQRQTTRNVYVYPSY